MGKGLMKKKCSKCGQEKLANKFGRKKTTRDGLQCWCKRCCSDADKCRDRYYRARDLMRSYGMTIDEYDELHQKQGGVCAICGEKETYKNQRGVTRLSVDHDHKTGKIRGLLCRGCNIFLGHLEKNGSLLPSAIDYLNLLTFNESYIYD